MADDLKLKRYLGDGLYVGFDGFSVWLYTDRYGRVHEVALEPAVMAALDRYRTDLALAVKAPDALGREQL